MIGVARDGSDLYYRQRVDGMVRFVARNLTTGAEREIVRAHAPALQSPMMSPDRKMIFALNPPDDNLNGFVLIDVASGKMRPVVANQPLGSEPGMLMWGPDSRSIFVRRTPEKGQPANILRIAIDTGTATTVDGALFRDGRMFQPDPPGRRLAFVINTRPAQSEIRVSTNLLSLVATR